MDAVHAKGSYIYLQLWALGRAARPELFHKEFPEYPYVSASPIPLSTQPNDIPRELTQEGTQHTSLSHIVRYRCVRDQCGLILCLSDMDEEIQSSEDLEVELSSTLMLTRILSSCGSVRFADAHM